MYFFLDKNLGMEKLEYLWYMYYYFFELVLKNLFDLIMIGLRKYFF